MSTALSPATAAQRSGLSRWTIVRAIQAGELRAHRNNRGHWAIDADAFDAWCNARSALDVQHSADAPPAPPDAQLLDELVSDLNKLRDRLTEAQVEAATLRAELAGAREQITAGEIRMQDLLAAERERREAVESDRDAWRTMAQRSWWEKWFGQ